MRDVFGTRRGSVLLCLMLLATLAGSLVTAHVVDVVQRERFEAQTARLDRAFADRVTTYVQVLRGGIGLFLSSEEVTREDWDTYVTSLRLPDRYPGFKSLTWAPAVAAADLPAFQARVRAERVPPDLGPADALADYTVRAPDGSSGTPEVHAPILYVAPFDELNRVVLGVDMMREPARRAAMTRAADTLQAVASPRLRLSGSLDQEAGFIVYVPVQRDGELLGWLTAAFLAERFIAGVDVARGADLDFELRDGGDALLYSTAGTDADGAPLPLGAREDAPYAASGQVPVPGGAWQVRYVAPDSFVPWASRLLPWGVAVLGLLASAAVALVVRGESRWRRAATELEAQAEDLRRARREAEAAAAERAAFLAIMTHEVRTPLHAVLGLNRLLLETTLDEEQRRVADTIGSSGEHLLHVVNGVLDHSRLESGQVQIERLPFDVAACASSVFALVDADSRKAGVRLAGVGIDTPRWVRGDENRLRQVLLNLVSNAVKFTAAGGAVTVELTTPAVDRLAFAVRDTGIGIPADRLTDLFEPYTQAQASTQRLYGGTGLGLSIARQLVRAMGGELSVASDEGVGSTFSFEIAAPVAAPPVASAGPAAPHGQHAVAAGLRVLVADDDEVNQELAGKMLHVLGAEVDVVGDGRAAVERARAGTAPYDVVFLDLHMPGMDGIEASRHLRDLGAARWLVALTGTTGEGVEEALHLAGFDDVVPKPFDVDDLAGAVARGRAGAPGVRPPVAPTP